MESNFNYVCLTTNICGLWISLFMIRKKPISDNHVYQVRTIMKSPNMQIVFVIPESFPPVEMLYRLLHHMSAAF